jgi:hypothetical protein
MSADDYRRALDAAVKEYEALGLQRAELDDRLTQLHQTIGTLLRLCGLEPTVPWGLTDACRTVLRNADVPLSPPDIRDRLVSIGCDLTRYSNELAAIHTVLRRLWEGGEIHTIAAPGKGLWRWTARPRTITLSTEAAERLRQSRTFHTSKTTKRTKKDKDKEKE